jgi:hypothetical protein
MQFSKGGTFEVPPHHRFDLSLSTMFPGNFSNQVHQNPINRGKIKFVRGFHQSFICGGVKSGNI